MGGVTWRERVEKHFWKHSTLIGQAEKEDPTKNSSSRIKEEVKRGKSKRINGKRKKRYGIRFQNKEVFQAEENGQLC